jgi:ACS family glucarate transporter-like MFS transporter
MKHRYFVLAFLCALSVILYLDRVCISVALPRIQAEFGIPPEQLGWVSLAFSISYAAFEIPSGHMADRAGPRRVLTRIVVWWSMFTALTGAVMGLPSLLVTRFLFGAGEAGAVPNISTAVSRWFPARMRAAAMGATAGAAQVGGALSPLLVVPIQQRYGWRAPFLVFALSGVAWAVVWYAWFRDTPAEKSGVSQAERDEMSAAPPPPVHGLPWRVALASGTLWGLIVTWFAGVYCAFFGIFWLPTYLVKARGSPA